MTGGTAALRLIGLRTSITATCRRHIPCPRRLADDEGIQRERDRRDQGRQARSGFSPQQFGRSTERAHRHRGHQYALENGLQQHVGQLDVADPDRQYQHVDG
ncbi:hypothetical protein [Burkholderia perseverans]|uniref:hypothetical protein n=1 Tax=Burkholderia perseverans TaxID=2615214 RepID=UPI001FF04C32|nr:hypothetical protein [Burkholderia perseverans]